MDKSEDKPAVPKPKDGIFSNWEDLKLYYQYRKDKSTEPFVPVVLEHFKRKKKNYPPRGRAQTTDLL